MGDFHQSGVITTFHRLGKYDLEGIEATLTGYTEYRPIAPALPCLYSELGVLCEAFRNCNGK